MNHLSAPFSLQYKDSCVISTIFQQSYEQSSLTWWESGAGALLQPIMQLRQKKFSCRRLSMDSERGKGKVGEACHLPSSFQSNCWARVPPWLSMPVSLGSVPTSGNLKPRLELESTFRTSQNVYPPAQMIEKNLNQILLESEKKKKKNLSCDFNRTRQKP